MEPFLPTAVLAAITLCVAGLLSFLLLRPATRPSQTVARRAELAEEKYFQSVLSETVQKSWSGTEQGCNWTQTDTEVEISTAMPDGARAKDVVCRVLPTTLSLSLKGATILNGTLFRRVLHEDCDWAIEESNGVRLLKLTLVKAQPTKGSQHWTSLLQQE
jgi:hypothetical protein